MQRQTFAIWSLKIGLIFIFGYFGIDKFLHPLLWIGWIPPWMDGLLGMTKDVWLQIIGGMEMLFALLLLIPIRPIQKTGAALMALNLIGILTQVGWNDMGARDFGLMMMSIALFLLL